MLHSRLVERTIDTIRQSGLPFVVYITGATASQFAHWLGDDVSFIDQGEGDLGDRLARVAAPAMLLGADVPGLTAEHLNAAALALVNDDVVIGPANDGGYYLLGFNKPVPFLFNDMAWGTELVFEETIQRLAVREIEAQMLGPLDDCDRPEDLKLWPELVD